MRSETVLRGICYQSMLSGMARVLYAGQAASEFALSPALKAQADIVLPPSDRAEKVMVSLHQGRGRFISPVSERVRWPGKCSSGIRARQVSRSNDSMVLCWTCRLCDTIKLGPHQTWLRAVCHSCHSVCSSAKDVSRAENRLL